MAHGSSTVAGDAAVEFDSRVLRHVMGHFCSGVVVVTSRMGGREFGMAAQSFTSLSLDPPLVSISPSRAPTAAGLPGLTGALAWIDCVIEAEHPAGDHTIVIGRVVGLGVGKSTAGPLLFFRGQYAGLPA
jgi:3-hydroxy-9,10-secoandrosta-1,3,5(10)-triene-9,17-dione monooxygenase reductase component